MTILVAALLPLLLAGALYLVVTARRPTPYPRRRVDLRPRLVRAVVGAVAVGLTSRWPVAAIAAAALGWYLPEVMGSRRSVEADLATTEAIASWTEMLRDTLAGPTGLEGAIEGTAPLAPKAIRPQVAALAARLRHQRPTQALRSFADELDHPVGDLVVAALSLSYVCPSSELGALLSALAESARAEAGMRLRVDTARARMRTAVRVIAAAMAATAVGLAVLARPFLVAYASASGQVMLGLIGLLWAWALVWLARLASIEGPERFFSSRLSDVAP